MSREDRKAMIAPERPGLSLSRQCQILSISRLVFYYTPKGETPENLALMRRIDELFMRCPFSSAAGRWCISYCATASWRGVIASVV